MYHERPFVFSVATVANMIFVGTEVTGLNWTQQPIFLKTLFVPMAVQKDKGRKILFLVKIRENNT